MIKACEKASKILIRDFGELEKLQVSKKGPKDFVTNSDIKAEKILIEELKKARPNYSIISEESGIEKNKDETNFWIIDPIDGTINFLHGIPHFAISIALKTKNEIVSGLIFDPIKAPIIDTSEIIIRKSYSIDILFKNISVPKPNKLLQVINIRDVPIASLNFNLEKIVKVGTIKKPPPAPTSPVIIPTTEPMTESATFSYFLG